MEKLTKFTWSILAVDAIVTLVIAIAARGGIAQVYAIFGVMVVLLLASIAGLSTVFYSRRGMWASLVLVTSPPVLLVFEATRFVSRA